jgi:hypothetical protein
MRKSRGEVTVASDTTGIIVVRGKRVIFDSDLAALYGESTKRLNQQVRRNSHRFPHDFAFQVSADEWKNLRLQFATSSWGGRRVAPYVFTEHGALMAATVLNSRRAIEVSIYLVRTFIAMREAADTSHQIAERLDELERSLEKRLTGHDETIAEILAALRELMRTPPPKNRPIGFVG